MKHIKYFLLIFLATSTLQSPPAFSAGEMEKELKRDWVGAFMLMTAQFSATMLQQVEIIGTFFDAKHQLETQRLFQQKVAEAHKDYQPSEQMCEIGTFVRNLARTEERVKISRNALQDASIGRELGSGYVETGGDTKGKGDDAKTQLQEYIDKFCNINDNAAQNKLLCETSKHVAQQNADINYTQTIDFPLTMDIDFTDPKVTKEEENIFAFLNQIFMNTSFPEIAREKTILHNFIKPYQEMRSLVAMRSVAQNSFAYIIGEKSKGKKEDGDITPFIRALLLEMGLKPKEINNYIGEDPMTNQSDDEMPSYHAQMEILTKKIFQHPEFISNLYDKPANVKRIRAALSAIKLMQDRDIYNAMQRREMLTSMILELQVRQKQNALTNTIEGVIGNLPDKPKQGSGSGAGGGGGGSF